MTWRRAMLALLLLVALVHGRALAFDFTLWDDVSTVAGNPRLTMGWAGLKAIWTQDQGALYIPVTYTAWWAIAHLFGVKAWAFHLFNLACHAAAAAGCLQLLRRLGFRAWAGLLGAAVFALHPLQPEAVAWVSGGKDVLAAALAIWAIWAHVQKRRALYWTLLLAAMLAKPGAAVVPAIVLLIDVTGGKRSRAVWATAAAGLALASAIALLAHFVQPAAAMNPAVFWNDRCAVAVDALGWYARALTGGTALCVDLGRRPEAAHAWLGLATLAIAAIAVASIRDKRAWLGAAIALLAVLPYLGFVPFEFQAYSTVAAHYAYLGMLGIAMVAAALVERLERRTAPAGPSRGRALPALRLLLAGSVAFLAWRCSAEARAFADSQSLFARVMSVNPASWAAPANIAVLALNRGDPEGAEKWARLSLSRKPRQVGANVTLGAALERAGDDAGAERAFRRALDADPAQAPAWSALGTLLARTARPDEAGRDLRRAIALDPYIPDPRAALGVLLAHSGDLPAAEAELARAALLKPSDAAIANNLLTVRQLLKDKAMRRNP